MTATLSTAPPSVREWLLANFAGRVLRVPRRIVDREAIIADLSRMSYREAAQKHGVSLRTVKRYGKL